MLNGKILRYYGSMIAVGFATFLLTSFFSSSKYPSCFPILEKAGYTVCYDMKNKVPFWVYERLTQESLLHNTERKNISFKEEKKIAELYRSTSLDYQNSGFDRGHMCPASNHRESKQSIEETFHLSNICPQHPILNRGLWKKLETYIRQLTTDYKALHVYTGPLYLPEILSDGKKYVIYQVIGKNDVAVPTHFFKIIFCEKNTGSIDQVLAYLLPNREIGKEHSLDEFISSTETIERVAGLSFPKHP